MNGVAGHLAIDCYLVAFVALHGVLVVDLIDFIADKEDGRRAAARALLHASHVGVLRADMLGAAVFVADRAVHSLGKRPDCEKRQK